MAIRLSRSQFGLAVVLACGMGFTGIAAAQTSGSTGTTTGTETTGDPVQIMFKRIDADGNGSISPSELANWRTNAILRLDADGDGKVTKQEIDTYMAQQQAQSGKTPQDSSAFFQAYDTNGDGAVDQNELKAGGERRFQSADTDANGELSMQEWQALNGS